ncbi:MAG TPA: LptF/LptG family permease [Bacteroidia bacterium]|jgi:lipopolysaccharide export system permease protein|nr:LptF/LptG family permease [Bacteroidia bacterium]
MKKLDIYILRKFLGTFVYSISLITVIIIIFDISEKIDPFIARHAPFKAIIFDYYLNFLPYVINLFSPLFTFIAVIFFTSRLAARSEIISILSSGISFRRFTYPYIAGAVLIAGLSLYLNHWVIPDSNKVEVEFENKYVRSAYRNSDMNIHKQILPGEYMFVEHFDNNTNTGYKFSLEHLDNQVLTYKMMAEYILWDSTKKDWKIYNYFVRKIAKDGTQSISSGMEKDTALAFTAANFVERLESIEAMNYTELNKYIDQQRLAGSNNILFFEVEKYKRTAFPFATFVLTFIGIALSSRKVRGGTGLHLGLGLLLAFSFILFMQVSTTFAEAGHISPLLSVWIPNVIYGILAFFMMRAAPK